MNPVRRLVASEALRGFAALCDGRWPREGCWLQAQAASAAKPREIDALVGAWQRTDGNYIILVSAVGAFGQLEATYINPRQLPFYKAVVTRDGDVLRLVFELRAGGYDGSTYELGYDRANDRLAGTFYQAVAKQRFDVEFERKSR